MARRFFTVCKKIALASFPAVTSPFTALQTVSGAACLAMLELTVAIAGTSATDKPWLVELLTQTTAGTMSALTPQLLDTGVTYSLLASAQHTATVEPTSTNVLRHWFIHPQTGGTIPLPLQGDITMAATTRLGIRVTVATTNYDAVFSAKFEE